MRRLALLLALTLAAHAADETQELRLNEGRFGHGSVLLGGDVYVLAGYGNDGLRGSIERIPADRGPAQLLEAAFTPRYWVGAATDGTTIFLAGGLAEDGAVDLLEAWTPGDAAPRALKPLPAPRSRVSLVYLNGKLYAIGGVEQNESRSGRVDIYDLATDTWSSGAPMPTPRECDAAVVEGRILVPGGYDGENAISVVELYDPATDTWTNAPALPLPLSAHHLALVGRTLYTFGSYHALDLVTAYDVDSGAWSVVDVPYRPSRHNEVVFDGTEVIVTGGNTSPARPYLNLVQRFPAATLNAAPRREPTEREKAIVRQRGSITLMPEVAALVDQWSAALAGLTQLTMERSIQTSLEGRAPGNPMTAEIAWQPHRLAYRYGQETLIYDGTNVMRDLPSDDAYLVAPASNVASALEFAQFSGRLFFEEVRALASRDPINELRRTLRAGPWQRMPDESLDGAPCWVLATTSMPGQVSGSDTLYISTNSGILLRRVIEMTLASEEDEDPPKRYRVEHLTTMINTTSEPPATAFEWQVPEGARRVASLGEIEPEQQDQSRFELSGKPAPDFSLPLLDESLFRLSDHTGRVVLLDFWATWCSPCVKAMPSMQKLHEKFSERGVVVVGVSSDGVSKKGAVAKLVEKMKLTYPIGVATNQLNADYFVQAIPCLVLIGTDGTVQSRHIGFSSGLVDELSGQIEKLLAGETLPSARALTDEELASRKQRRTRSVRQPATRMDARAFTLVWSTNLPERSASSSSSFFRQPISVRLPLSTTVIESDGLLQVIRMSDGSTIASVPRPTSTIGSETQMVGRWIYLETPDGGRVACTTANREPTEEENSFRLTNTRLLALRLDGTEAWSIASSSGMDELTALPLGPQSDALLVNDYNSFSVYRPDGTLLMQQHISHLDRLDIMDLDRDGQVEFFLTTRQLGCYRLKPELFAK